MTDMEPSRGDDFPTAYQLFSPPPSSPPSSPLVPTPTPQYNPIERPASARARIGSLASTSPHPTRGPLRSRLRQRPDWNTRTNERRRSENRRGAVTKTRPSRPRRARSAASASADASADFSDIDDDHGNPHLENVEEYTENARQTLQAQSRPSELPLPVDASLLRPEDNRYPSRPEDGSQIQEVHNEISDAPVHLESTDLRQSPPRPPRIRVYYDDRLFGIGKHEGRWLFYDCCGCSNPVVAFAPGWVSDGKVQQCAVCKKDRCRDCSQTWMVADRHVEGVGVLPLPQQALEMEPLPPVVSVEERDGGWNISPAEASIDVGVTLPDAGPDEESGRVVEGPHATEA